MSMIPYQKLTDDQKKVTFHVDGSSDDPVRHSGILPSGEGNNYDPSQVLRNDTIFDTTAGKPVLRGGSSNRQVDPTSIPPAAFHPSGLEFTNITASGKVTNNEAYEQGRYLPDNFNALSNNTKWLNSGLVQGGYLHYLSNSNVGLLPDDKTNEYYPLSMITPTSGTWNPYPEYGDIEQGDDETGSWWYARFITRDLGSGN